MPGQAACGVGLEEAGGEEVKDMGVPGGKRLLVD